MNREIEVALCGKRTDSKYTNRKMTWAEFVLMLKTNKVTSETHAEYMKMTKGKQGEIKDVGGFVSGYLKNGSRKINDVIRKSFITLDIDDKARNCKADCPGNGRRGRNRFSRRGRFHGRGASRTDPQGKRFPPRFWYVPD